MYALIELGVEDVNIRNAVLDAGGLVTEDPEEVLRAVGWDVEPFEEREEKVRDRIESIKMSYSSVRANVLMSSPDDLEYIKAEMLANIAERLAIMTITEYELNQQ